MGQYIDKAAVVAEIERRMKALHSTLNERETAVKCELKDFLSFLNTIEVKDVDLKKELSYEDYIRFFEEHPDFPDDWGFDEAWVFAKHFFELGIKASQKGE